MLKSDWQEMGHPKPADFKGSLFEGVSPKTKSMLAANSLKIAVGKGRQVYHPDSPRNTHIYFVVSGAFRVRVQENRQWKTISIRHEGEFFGESECLLRGQFNGKENRAVVTAEVESEVIVTPWPVFAACAYEEGSSFDFRLMQNFVVALQEIIVKRTRMITHPNLTASDHVKKYLRERYESLSEEKRNAPEVEFSIYYSDLMERSKVSRLRIYQILNSGMEGLIKFSPGRKRQSVRILDKERLLEDTLPDAPETPAGSNST